MDAESMNQAAFDNATMWDHECDHVEECGQCSDIIRELEDALETAQEEIMWLSKTLHKRMQLEDLNGVPVKGAPREDTK